MLFLVQISMQMHRQLSDLVVYCDYLPASAPNLRHFSSSFCTMDEAADFVVFAPSAFRCLTHLTWFPWPVEGTAQL
jgi:hypothetical protein